MAQSGTITRSNLATPLADLGILVDPYWPLVGDDSEAADASMKAGLEVSQSAHKYVWANSPFVAGQLPVLATPDNSTLNLRLVIDGESFADAQSKIAPIVVAITQQIEYTVSVTFDDAPYSWTCYTGDYEVAFNQLHYYGYLVPMYLTLPRAPIPVAGPI